MKEDKQIDMLLKQVLSVTKEPDDLLNQTIIAKAKERNAMSKKRRMPMVAAAALTILALSGTALAASRFLGTDKVAEKFEDYKLADAFKGKDAVSVNKTVQSGQYDITLLGIVSGTEISDYIATGDDEILSDRTYAVVAIANTNGTPMPSTSDENYGQEPFFVSPLIKGLKPWQYNIATMNGGYQDFVEDGIMYRLIECNNVEMFADRGIYLCVSDTTFYNVDAYDYDELTGAITPNSEYEGINVLFDLPIDISKANREKADAYINEMEAGKNKKDSKDEEEINESVDTSVLKNVEGDVEERVADGTLLKDSVKELTADVDGAATYTYEAKDGSGVNLYVILEDIFAGIEEGFSPQTVGINGDEESVQYIVAYRKDADGKMYGMMYQFQ
ncbi:MAG: hypothetical protein KIC94_11840 [Clostridiales bacterium]|nr:hypothetical protein [Clostridiales bacterium]